MRSADLLPTAAAQQFQRKRITAAWAKWVVGSLLVTAVLIYTAQLKVISQRQMIEQQRSLAQYPRQAQAENQQLHRRLVGLQFHEAQQIKLRSKFSPLVIVAMLRDVKDQLRGALEVVSFEFVDESDHDSQGKDDPRNGYVALQLVTDSTTNSSLVMQSLRDSKYFKHVTLSSALEKFNSNSSDVRFSVRCDF